MKIQPPQFLMAGIILLVFGVQCMLVDSYVLSEQASQVLSSQLDITAVSTTGNQPLSDAAASQISTPVLTNRYTIRLPQWLSWSLLSCAGLCFIWTIRTARR